jgi:hypothetical protein
VLVARALIGQGGAARVAAGVRDDAPPPMQAVKLFAQLALAPAGPGPARAALLEALHALVEGAEAAAAGTASTPAAAAAAPLVQAIAATAYIAEGALERALRAVRSEATMELLALAVQAYLRLDRPDLAEAAVRKLEARDDESALYMLSAAHTYAVLGGDKAKEAVLILKDVLDRYGEGAGPAAYNGLVAAYLAARNYSAAEKVLAEAAAKDPHFPDTLANTVTLAYLQGKPAAAEKALAVLRREAPGHPALAALAIGEGSLDRVEASFSS